ncbi:MAG: hypothetical protein ABIP89_01560, partial [Polyangiaceae bacterium]
ASGLALAGPEDRSVAEAILTKLDADAAHKSLTSDPSARAHAALERAARMRASGDEPHARLADGLAREWAELGRDLVATADSEKKAADARRNATDAGAHAERERALLDEGIAQNGRLRAQLEAADREHEPEKTAKVGASLDAGASALPAPKKLMLKAPFSDGGR